MSFTDKHYNRILDRVREWVAELDRRNEADIPIYSNGGPDGSATGVSARRILTEVEGRTELGQALVDNWVELAADHIVGAPLH